LADLEPITAPAPIPKPQTFFSNGLANFLLGLKVLYGECRWICLKALRGAELSQMRKRLDQEYGALGKALADQLAGLKFTPGQALPPAGPQTELGLKQIEFLKEEIEFMLAEQLRQRSEFIATRRKLLGIRDEDQS